MPVRAIKLPHYYAVLSCVYTMQPVVKCKRPVTS